jgi:transcriptional regulator with XRE-family HTH domain
MLPMDGKKIRAWRESKGYSQNYVADTIGMSRNAFGNWERGHPKNVTNAYMEKLLKMMAGEDVSPATGDADSFLSVFAEELRGLARVLESQEISTEIKAGRFKRFFEEVYGGLDEYIRQVRGQ